MMTAFNNWWHRRTKRQKKWLKVLAVILGLYGSYELSHLKYHPWRNWHPKYYVTIKGHVDPAIKDIVKLQWVAHYYTSVSRCAVMFYSIDDGGLRPRSKMIYFTPTINSSGNYQIKIPIDYYIPGYCQWAIDTIDDASDTYFSDEYYNAKSFMQFSPYLVSVTNTTTSSEPEVQTKKGAILSGGVKFGCQFDVYNMLKCRITDYMSATMGSKLLRNENYIWQQDYYLQNKQNN